MFPITSFTASLGHEHCPHRPDLRTLSPGSPSLHTADQPRSVESHPNREPGADPRAGPRAQHPESLSRSFTEPQPVHRATRGIGSELMRMGQ